MKKLLRLICLILTITCICNLAGCNLISCDLRDCKLLKPEPTFNYQEFKCCYIRGAETQGRTSKANATGVNVLTFIEKDKRWDRVVIPNFIDGLPVIATGMNGIGWMDSVRYDGYYDKIYIPSSLQYCTPADAFWRCTVFLLDTQGDEFMEYRKTLYNYRLDSTQDTIFVVFESKYEWYQEFFSVHKTSLLVIANVTYIVDGVEYWMDYCKNGEYLLSPPEPVKDGCEFDGWYTDETYLNRWDFENTQYNKPEDEITLKLYAKFLV